MSEYLDDYDEFRRKPLEKGKMNIKKLRKKIKKANGISEVGDALEIFLTQFSKLELRWIDSHIRYGLNEKYNIGVI